MIDRRAAGPALIAVLGLAACGSQDGGEVTSPCGFSEPGNDAFASAVDYELGTERMGCIGATAGRDFFALEVDESSGAGYLQFQIDGEPTGQLGATLYADSADSELGHVAAEGAGVGLGVLVAVSPAVRYRLAVGDESGASTPFSYRLTGNFTAVADRFEPNDSRAAAAPITAGVPVDAFLFGGAATMAGVAPYDDYFRVSLQAGMTVAVRIENVPADLAARLFIYDGTGSEIGRVTSGHPGESLTLRPPTLPAGGEHTVAVGVWPAAPEAMYAGTTPPVHFTSPYRLLVSQP